MYHGELTGQLGKLVRYDINEFCLCRSGFHVPNISDSGTKTVLNFVKVVHVPATCRPVGRPNNLSAVVAESFWPNKRPVQRGIVIILVFWLLYAVPIFYETEALSKVL